MTYSWNCGRKSAGSTKATSNSLHAAMYSCNHGWLTATLPPVTDHDESRFVTFEVCILHVSMMQSVFTHQTTWKYNQSDRAAHTWLLYYFEFNVICKFRYTYISNVIVLRTLYYNATALATADCSRRCFQKTKCVSMLKVSQFFSVFQSTLT